MNVSRVSNRQQPGTSFIPGNDPKKRNLFQFTSIMTMTSIVLGIFHPNQLPHNRTERGNLNFYFLSFKI